MSKLVPQYTAWEAINTALALAARAIEEVRSVARTPGPKGEDGQDGKPGMEGPTGKLPLVSEWEDRIYYQGAVVSYDGSLYQASRDTARPTSHEDWTCIVRGGQDGRSFNIRGTWAEDKKYNRLDVVALGGASFAAKRDNPGPCPGEGWQLIAAQGKRGNPGERGAVGVGDRGAPGPKVIAMSVDDDGLLTLQNADGSIVECDLYPVLAKLQ